MWCPLPPALPPCDCGGTLWPWEEVSVVVVDVVVSVVPDEAVSLVPVLEEPLPLWVPSLAVDELPLPELTLCPCSCPRALDPP